MRVLVSQSNRAPHVAKTIRAGTCAGSVTVHRLSLSRRALRIGAIAPLLLLGLASCGGKKTPLVTDPRISQTLIYRGVFPGSPGLISPGLPPGTVSLSVVEVWDARPSMPVGPESVATIDSVAVQVVVGDRRSIFPGRFDRSTGALTASGASWLNATLNHGRFEGPDRRFIAIPAAAQTIRAYGGSWSGTGPSGDDRGSLSILIEGTVVTGVARHEDETIDWVEGTYDSLGGIAMTFPGYMLTGSTSRYAIFGDYDATLEGGRSGTWTTGPLSF